MFKRFLLAPTLIFLLLLGIGQVSTPTAYAIGNKPFTFVWMSDTQYYSQHYPYIYDSMTEWIVENERSQSIKYAIHTGDIVDHMTNEFEWVQADLAMKKLDQAKIPYGVLAGNHDVGHSKLDYSTYSRYFGDARFNKSHAFKGSYKDNEAHFDEIHVSGHKFLILYLGFGWNDETLQWAKEVVQDHPHHATIVATHRYLQVNGKRSEDGDKLFKELIKPSPSIQLVLSGHYHGTAQRFDRIDDDGDGVNERTVVQILSDYQGYEKGGNGFMRLLTFQPKSQAVTISTYSPYTKEDSLENEDFHKAPMTFSFPMDF
ncbi:metallophosphoesterase [Shouchella clausii]|uniref:metallophosphoesterase n=1 Tax=Shouchella clausii TaxID=79880 RepID=UPI002149236D|nr:metallophosphoesterase [Shouchella clausii]MCR1290162.1 metallophosphoesterase [Shouchella clausii]